MPTEALVRTLPVRTQIFPEPVPEPVEVPEAEGHEDEHEADLRIVVVSVLLVSVPPVTGPEVLVASVAIPVVGESGGDGHGYHHKDGEGQEHDSTHKLPPL